MRKPNIIFFHIDEQNLLALGATGCRDVSTPNIDRLFDKGMWFQHCCVSNPLCSPSRASWYTGLMSEEHGQLNLVDVGVTANMDASIADIGPLVQSGGYDSVYMGKWHIAKPVEMSFDMEFRGHPHGEIGDAYTTRAAEAFLVNRKDDTKPFFLNIGLLNPHDCCMWTYQFDPCGPGKFSMAKKLEKELPELPRNHYLSAHPTERSPEGADYLTRGHWTDLDWRYYMYCYYRNVEMVDAEVGRVFDALENSRFADNTILIFSSDHGDGLAQHYHYGKECLLEHSVMVPLVIVDPTRQSRRNTTHMVSSIDLTATICDYAGVDPLPGRRGLSLRPLIEGKSPAWRPYAASTTSMSRERIIRTPEYKLLNDRLTREYVLYDLIEDPWEMRNFAEDPSYAKTLARMKSYMDENEATYHYAPQTVQMLETWEKLRRSGQTSVPMMRAMVHGS